MQNIKTVQAIVSGKVQGVFFRYFTKQAADRLSLKGFVRNLSDGSVEAIAQGQEDNLQQFLKMLEKGPPASKVDSIKTKLLDSKEEFKNFEIKYF